MDFTALADRSLSPDGVSRPDVLEVLRSSDDDLLPLVEAAYRVRTAHFGKKIKLNHLVNLQSGACSENCAYCSQSGVSRAPISIYPLISSEKVLQEAARAVELKASRLCLVSSGREPSSDDIERVTAMVRLVRERFPSLEICCSLGLMTEIHTARLREAGVNAYNHNVNTSPRYYTHVCSTHTYDDRCQTIRKVKESGMSTCSGVLLGMGETPEDVADMAFELRRLGADSIPVNFLIPIPGTGLEQVNRLTPRRCLRALCAFRFVNPSAELRIAGGRELHLRSLQPLGLLVANSLFIGDYLTTEGENPSDVLDMIADMGLEILGAETSSAAESPVDLSGRVRVR
ncbi:MAG TPA: biotin synthase BioB [Elusimicrobiota bacterium]|nr:biotin synthase BioB [Elusimicrobiota bacterium]